MNSMEEGIFLRAFGIKMLIERYDFDGVKARAQGIEPLIVTTDTPRKAIFQKLNRAGGMTTKKAPRRMTRRGPMVRGNSFVGQRNGQRVVVKIRYVKHKPVKAGGGGGSSSLRDHLKYINRTGAGKDNERAELFVAADTGFDRKDFLATCSGDRHHFRFIISPENGHAISDFQGYVRDIMTLVEKDLGTKLEWVAAAHYDTQDPHAHVIVRGKNDRGEDLVIGQDYIKEGVRRRAQEVATQLLGERSLDEIQKSLEKEVDAWRVTSLDRFIDRQADSQQQVDVRRKVNFGKSIFYEGIIKGRLQFLRQAGLAEEDRGGIYVLKADYKDILSDIARRNEIMKRVHNKVDLGLSGLSIFTLKDGEGPTVEGQVVAKGVEDELYDRNYIVVKAACGQHHYVPVNGFNQFEQLEKGALIRVRPGQAPTGKADRNIAEQAKDNGGIYDAVKHRAFVDQNQDYIPEDERNKYIESHIVRLGTLEKNGAAEQLGEGVYKVPADVVAQGEEINRQIAEKEKKRFYPAIAILSAVPADRLTEVAKKTWLDRELYKHGTNKQVSELLSVPEISAALEQRKAWLIKQDLAIIQSNGDFALRERALNRLDKMEVYGAGRALAEKMNLTFNDGQVRPDTVMRYEGYIALESGHWAVATRDKSLHLAPIGKDPQLERGAQIVFEKVRETDRTLQIKSLKQQQIQQVSNEPERGL